MDTQTGAARSSGIGRTTTAAAVAGLAGLVISLLAASSLLIGTVFGARSPGLAGGYEDYGQRHRADFAATDIRSQGRLDDYGIRCLAVGWCSMPKGVPQPAGISATH